MHALRVLQRWCERNQVIEHRARVRALCRVVQALLDGGKLALTRLGRCRGGRAFVEHHIKAVDRLLGNRHSHAERVGVYRALAHTLLRDVAHPLRYACTRRPERIVVLLLIAALASPVLWLLGLAAKARRWTRHFQVNTERERDVLSTVFVGQQLWSPPRLTVTWTKLIDAFNRLGQLLAYRGRCA